jgi:aryl-alcohol dehydrogenase-like predicted oxidoreductase
LTAYGVLSRGLLSGSKPAGKGDFRAHMPRFSGENFERNQQLVAKLQDLAGKYRATPAQLAIAWVLAKNASIVPVIGARKRTQLEESLRAVDIHLSAADVAAIEQAIPADAVAGTRYDANGMRTLDSEK